MRFCHGFAGFAQLPVSVPTGWEYIDPKGNVQGRFSAKEMTKWADGGFFAADQKV